MKLSNKILLGAFLFIVLVLTGLHAALRIKFERGDLVVLGRPTGPKVQKAFNNVKNVVITGMGEFDIFSSDTTRVILDSNLEEKINLYMSGDTLFFGGKLSEKEYKSGRKNYFNIDIFLPEVEKITLRHAEVNLRGTADSLRARSYNIELYESELRLQTEDYKRASAWWNEMNVKSHFSSIVFIDSSLIRNLQLTLLNSSTLQDQKAIFENFSLHMDSTSSASLQGVNFKKLQSIKE